MNLDDIATRLEALGNPTRLRIFQTLVRAGDAGLSVGRLQDRIGIAASTLTHHCQRLMQVGLVTQERQATTLICRANYPMLHAVTGALVEQCCAEAAPETQARAEPPSAPEIAAAPAACACDAE
ncbi:ArsR/SmtB family transcription factor [Rhabdaerophilum calidifontis]|uniref:ArsR/SmtB family transcription factor n=1 Tax=Rhabdaerophilum calidifontis TaxID=2604328 RepID=UPI001239725F|nr:metalloregulator ArsR/SmtB family transcription factor [Rhabdaerophilum calidifontis]